MISFLLVLLFAVTAICQQQCYYGAGADHRGPASLVPCKSSGTSACCLLGDTCLSGNTCYNYKTGDLYQYGCTDITYQDASCPFKCGFNTTKSPWTALEYCNDLDGVTNTWVCHAPESCGCQWNSTFDLLVLQPQGCKEMGSNARVALLAPSTLAPFVSLPSTFGGSTGYYSGTTINGTSTWVSTAVSGYTPDAIKELTAYAPGPFSIVQIDASATPSPSTLLTPATTTATTTALLGTASGSSAIAASASTAASGPASSEGLSSGAQAGIGAGVGIGGVLIGALVVALCLSRRRKNRHPHAEQPPMMPQHQPYTPSYTPAEKVHVWSGTQSPSPFSDRSMSYQHPAYVPPGYDSPYRPPPTSPPSELPGHVTVAELATRTSRGDLGQMKAGRTYN